MPLLSGAMEDKVRNKGISWEENEDRESDGEKKHQFWVVSSPRVRNIQHSSEYAPSKD